APAACAANARHRSQPRRWRRKTASEQLFVLEGLASNLATRARRGKAWKTERGADRHATPRAGGPAGPRALVARVALGRSPRAGGAGGPRALRALVALLALARSARWWPRERRAQKSGAGPSMKRMSSMRRSTS